MHVVEYLICFVHIVSERSKTNFHYGGEKNLIQQLAFFWEYFMSILRDTNISISAFTATSGGKRKGGDQDVDVNNWYATFFKKKSKCSGGRLSGKV